MPARSCLVYNLLLDRVVDEMVIASGLPRPMVYQINTDALNVCAVGRDPKNASNIVNLGTATKLKSDELRAVIAHEMAHIKNRVILYNTILAALVGVGVAIWIYVLGGRVVQAVFSRCRGILADVQAVEFTRFPEGMINALKKFKLESNDVVSATTASVHLFMASALIGTERSLIFETHSPIIKRIERIRHLTEVPVQVDDFKSEAV